MTKKLESLVGNSIGHNLVFWEQVTELTCTEVFNRRPWWHSALADAASLVEAKGPADKSSGLLMILST